MEWDLFALARRNDCPVVVGAPLGDPDCRSGQYRDWLFAIKKAAMPWRAALCYDLQQRPIEESIQLLDYLEIDFWELQQLARGEHCEVTLRPLLEEISRQRTVIVRGHRIYEADDGWRSKKDGGQICNGIVKIDEIAHCRSSPVQLVGSVQVGDQQKHFQISAPDVQRQGLFAFVKQLMPEFNYRKGWNSSSDLLTTLLHRPHVQRDADVVGWRDCRFWFPRFSIMLGGNIRTDETTLVTDVTPPALMFAPPVPLTKDELRLLSRKGRENRIFWATAACIAFNVYASFRNMQHRGIGLVGTGGQALGAEAARLLGCTEFRVPVGQRRSSVETRLEKECNRHNWPVLLMPSEGTKSRIATNWMAKGGLRNCLMPLDNENALPLGHALHLVRSDKHFGTLAHLARVGPKVLPAYLQSICLRHGSVFSQTDCPLLNTLQDLADWFQEAGGDGQTVRRAAGLLQAAGLLEAAAMPSARATGRRQVVKNLRELEKLGV
jgi:hypothetical protein